MLRGGGLCVEGPAGSSLPRVSPRIRALQDRLLDSLPADGAWECLSPAQREAIISLHRARLTRNFVGRSDSPERKKPQNRKSKGLSKGLNRYGRSRSYEDKLESETDDSGVRVLSGGTNSSTSNSHNSHEDDSSDPGVKRAGRFTKSPSADRSARKEAKSSYDLGKRKGVTNGVGNVNKIISKQLNRTGHQSTNNVTLECRNVPGEKRRIRGENDSSVFETKQNYNRNYNYEGKSRSFEGEKQTVKQEGISRKNILQRYQNYSPKILKETKENASSEEYDSGVNFRFDRTDNGFDEILKIRRPSSGIDYDFESDRTPRSDSTPSPCVPSRSRNVFEGYQMRSKEAMLEDDLHTDRCNWDNKLFVSKTKLKEKQVIKSVNKNCETEIVKSSLKVGYGAKLNSNFDYRNEINQEGMNKYSSNWNNIILSRDVPIKTTMVVNNKNIRGSQCYQAPVCHGKSTEKLSRAVETSNKNCEIKMEINDPKYIFNANQEKNLSKKYLRSKSLDRKYLEDSSDEESDFEVRRRTERMRRYAKASQEWEANKLNEKSSEFPRTRNVPFIVNESSKPRAKSSWDISQRHAGSKEHLAEDERNCFRSRSNILNKWKSEESELAINVKYEKRKPEKNVSKFKWRRRSCDFELDNSDCEATEKKKKGKTHENEFSRKEWQRRSCDFELEIDEDDEADGKVFYEEDWDNSVDKEMKILQQRKQQNPKAELRRMYPVSPKKERNFVEKGLLKEEIELEEAEPLTREKILRDNTKYQMRPEICGRKWARIEDHHRTTQSYHPIFKQEKNKTPHAFRGKLRLFKSILSF